jgi:hypothetical protein
MQRAKKISQKSKVKTAAVPDAAQASTKAAKPPKTLLGERAELDIQDTKYELSLAEFPLFILSARIPEGIKAINYSDTITVNNKPVERHWRVTWNMEYGAPGQSASGTFFALYQIWKDANFDSPWIHFDTIAALLKRKGIKKSKDSHTRIMNDLNCLQGIYIEAKNAFYDKAEKKYVDQSFHLFEGLIIKKDTPGSPDGKSKGYIKAHPFLHHAAQNTSFLLGIPEKAFFALPSLQQRLFLHLRKMLLMYSQYTRNIDDLAAQLPIFTTTRKAKYMIKQAAKGLIEAAIIPFFDKVIFLKNNNVRFERVDAEQLSLFDPQESAKQTEEEKLKAESNFALITEHCKDKKSYTFYRVVAARMTTEDIYRAISETKETCYRNRESFSPKLFTSRILSIAEERGVKITKSGPTPETAKEAKKQDPQKNTADENFKAITKYCKDTHNYQFYRAAAECLSTEDINGAIADVVEFQKRSNQSFNPTLLKKRIEGIAQERKIIIPKSQTTEVEEWDE